MRLCLQREAVMAGDRDTPFWPTPLEDRLNDLWKEHAFPREVAIKKNMPEAILEMIAAE